MKSSSEIFIISLSILLLSLFTFYSNASEGNSFVIPVDKNPCAIATFECLGIYYQVDSYLGECNVNYRKSGAKEWRSALTLWFDGRDKDPRDPYKRPHEYRGSIVGLTPDTEYDICLNCGDKEIIFQAKTRSEKFQVGKTTFLKSGGDMVHITESGRPDAWHLVTHEPESEVVIDVKNQHDCNMVIDASYVIVCGLELKNACIHGILIKEGAHDVVVDGCHITFWGRCGGPKSAGNVGVRDGGVFAETGASGLIIQRNLICNPRGASNDWETGHPRGPNGICLRNSKGGNIIRYNEIRSTEDHGYDDGIGGATNSSFSGCPNRDSDIYGNIVSNVWDDAIESEGANMNVRIWGNYLHHTMVHIATAGTSKGPLYIFRNVFGLSRRSHKDPLGLNMIKVGGRDGFTGGRKYIFHNTSLQPKGAFSVFSRHKNSNTIARNNIFDCPGRFFGRDDGPKPDPTSDYDYDLFTGIGPDPGPGYEEHGIVGKELPFTLRQSYICSQGLEWYLSPTAPKKNPAGPDFIQNPAIDTGVILPGFNDDYKGKAPDLGAFEGGNPPLEFGRRAGKTIIFAP